MIESVASSKAHPRARIIDAFLHKYPKQIESLALNCQQCQRKFVSEILHGYSTIRIFFYVKLFNAKIKKSKKGAELNKDKKLNL